MISPRAAGPLALLAGLCALGSVTGSEPAAGDGTWTRFRGPRMDGHFRGEGILTEWPPEGPPRLWKREVGGGHASFVVAAGRAFTLEQRGEREVAAAYDLATGEELWAHGWEERFEEVVGGAGPRATPTWDDGRLYALGATGELRALDAATGSLLWRRAVLREAGAPVPQYGVSGAPLIVDDKVVVLAGGRPGASVLAYDKRSGEPVWRSLDDRQAYTSPMLVTLAGRRQLLVVSAERAVGLAPENGALLWDYPWVTESDVNAAQPLVLDERRFLLSAGYDHGAAVVEVHEEGEGLAATTVWANRNLRNRFSSSVLHEGYVYGLDETILVCLDPATGERKWKGGRYGRGGLLLAAGRLIVTTEGGSLVLVRATPDGHEELASLRALQGKTWNSPALADGILLVRNTTQAAAYDLNTGERAGGLPPRAP